MKNGLFISVSPGDIENREGGGQNWAWERSIVLESSRCHRIRSLDFWMSKLSNKAEDIRAQDMRKEQDFLTASVMVDGKDGDLLLQLFRVPATAAPA